MLFNSTRFLVFLAIVLAVYYPLSHKYQNRFLLAASLFFYASWDWRFLAPLLFTTTIDYWCASRIEHAIAAGYPVHRRKPWLTLSVVANLSLLGFFKYFNFFAASARDALALAGIEVNPQVLHIVLPLGISFYTFQALSYTIDVYRGQLHATRSYPDFLLAVLYFPHLVAGPIQRASSLLPQVANPRHPDYDGIVSGLHLMVWGYFKKVWIADNLAPIVNNLFSQPHLDGFQVLMAAYAFAFQIYCDFSGYTDIARGIAKLMGFEFMLNFRLPYFSADPKEFWARWHISLSTWLRDYLYVPLGGNRRGPARTYTNLMIVMIIGGLWHGAAWTFVVWGLYHGLLVVLFRALGPRLENRVPYWIRAAVFFHLTCYGWLIFRATSLNQLAAMTGALFHPFGQIDLSLASGLILFIAPLIVVQTIQWLAKRMDFLSFRWAGLEARTICYATLLYLTLFRGGQPRSFIYFQF